MSCASPVAVGVGGDVEGGGAAFGQCRTPALRG